MIFDSDCKLPPELWLIIFRLATRPDDGQLTSIYEPFEGCFDLVSETVLRTRRSLVQVCRTWRALAIVFLYEDVRVRPDVDTLSKFLESDGPSTPGRWVRRLELPYTLTDHNSSTDVVQILQSCPFLHTLVRPYLPEVRRETHELRFGFPTGIVALSSLTRLDWWHYHTVARSGGINSLVDVLDNAPYLEYLTLGGEFHTAEELGALHLPALTTLRLRRVSATLLLQICGWVLPSLAHIIVDFSPESYAIEQVWSTFGPQLSTVEFGRNVVFLMSDQIASFLRAAPTSVKTFNYFVFFTMSPQLAVEAEASVERVGVHAFPCKMLPNLWEHLDRHFWWLSGPSLPALQHVVLYGDWSEIMKDPRFPRLRGRLEGKGCEVKFASESIGWP
ncbi:hypothetical protein EDC04DRAFT_27880 [Pisolithus marmoratus]|nr:hypothetical protein EDC04DRAFT_27880 [Pisolithus marmoratus]